MKLILFILCALWFGAAQAQIKGVVLGEMADGKKEPIYGAKVRLLQSGKRDITTETGEFRIILPKELPDTMVVSARGFYNDTIIVTKDDRFTGMAITLYSDVILPDVVVSYWKSSRNISRMKVLHVEELSDKELRKAACCNLSESFETNAAVDVNISDAVSGAKKIQMMGLDGVYTQIQMENIPYLRGLETSFGLGSIPGTWIESIQITKGTGNVVNGYESMAGLINLELKKPEQMERLYLNAYVNRMGRNELNFNSGFKLNDKWSSGWFAHYSSIPLEMDGNDDGFRDVPTGMNLAVLNRYNYEGENMEAQFGINAHMDDKIGGQMSRLDVVGDRYLVNIKSRHIDAFGKTGFFMKQPYNSIGVVYNLKYQSFDASFGPRVFEGEEKRGYINAIYDGIFGNTDHKYKVGVSGVYSDIYQRADSLVQDRVEIVPGAFFEYTMTSSRHSLVAGVRGDYHNLFGFQYAPRVHYKFALTEYTDLRATGGKGWRVPNYLIDNVSLLANNQEWIAPTESLPEVSWNVGGSFVQRFKLFQREGSLVLDFYHTTFENQLVVDRDANTSAIVFSNLDGGSFSNSFQSELTFRPFKTIELRFAYKYLDVRAEFGGILQQQVMVPKHRGFANLGHVSRNKRWEFDITASVFGQARLPQVMLPNGELSTVNTSEVFAIVNAQLTHVYKRWDFYLGGENLGNYRQSNPIIDAANPFSDTFNATRVWAPIFGMNIYAGIRFSIEQPEEGKK
ncbi:MAG: TonB-dependent receptor [bacterium]|nr:TonB-dependent receptor [bacterium]